VESYKLIDYREYPIRSSGEGGVCEQQLQVSLRVTVTLGGIGTVRDFSDSLEILRGESDLPSFYVLFEVLRRYYRQLDARRDLDIKHTGSRVVPGMGMTSSP